MDMGSSAMAASSSTMGDMSTMSSMVMTATSVMDSMTTMASMDMASTTASSMSMDMASTTASSMSMDMASASTTMVMSMASATSSASSTGSSMAGMNMSGMSSSSDKCTMSMLWNWNTKNSCFLASGWHVKTRGQFAGTCISIFVWTFLMVALTRLRRDIDNWLIKRRTSNMQLNLEKAVSSASSGNEDMENKAQQEGAVYTSTPATPNTPSKLGLALQFGGFSGAAYNSDGVPLYRPGILEQIIRALLYAFEFSVTWLLALILMSYNGYVLISAFLGAFFGFLFVYWEPVQYVRGTRMTGHCC